MHSRLRISTHSCLMALPLLASVIGCSSERRQAYDLAMQTTITDLRAGDFAGAGRALDTARQNAEDDGQEEKVEQFSFLVAGADAYSRGDRNAAGAAWSNLTAPELRNRLVANQSNLGVTIAPAKGK